ncbi:hypothetical protein CEUSTIGMA_g6098.t1 [Chlamydomonas eustigma]|uniref:diacylglycerol O-acyltransferase n=1 Tax=Chlamydomonas eustigma TaxID=1157962 RepID=A0A250X7C4_9CHLO|nr:hypothetical protein CEUSTIGMA_g6098.t1 [Chlamydomonas eustigma]|eukprot:GAX78660.1 hypothetical protein CEUSTIGMA_g6098.t1 [Chlamydomonas eustigma]
MFLLRRKNKKPREEGVRVLDLEKELERAQLLNKQLVQRLSARDVMVGEYLYCYRTVALPLLGNEWELRYFVLNGQLLKQYKSAKDVIYSPREELCVMGCSVEFEGLMEGGKHWSFAIIDPRGQTLLRLSALSKAVADKWVSAFQQAGCALAATQAVEARQARSSSLELSRKRVSLVDIPSRRSGHQLIPGSGHNISSSSSRSLSTPRNRRGAAGRAVPYDVPAVYDDEVLSDSSSSSSVLLLPLHHHPPASGGTVPYGRLVPSSGALRQGSSLSAAKANLVLKSLPSSETSSSVGSRHQQRLAAPAPLSSHGAASSSREGDEGFRSLLRGVIPETTRTSAGMPNRRQQAVAAHDASAPPASAAAAAAAGMQRRRALPLQSLRDDVETIQNDSYQQLPMTLSSAAPTAQGSTKPQGQAAAATAEPADQPSPQNAVVAQNQEEAAASRAARRQHQTPMLASTPVHTAARFSYLSSERIWHEKHSGLYNLAAVIMVVTNFRLGLENALKYGFRPFKLLSRLTIGNPNIPLALCYPLLMFLTIMSLVTELLALRFLKMEAKIMGSRQKKYEDAIEDDGGGNNASGANSIRSKAGLRPRARLHDWLLFLCMGINTTSVIVIPWIVIYQTKAEPVAAFILFMNCCVLWMKLISFHHVSWDIRRSRREAGYSFLGSYTSSIATDFSRSSTAAAAAVSDDIINTCQAGHSKPSSLGDPRCNQSGHIHFVGGGSPGSVSALLPLAARAATDAAASEYDETVMRPAEECGGGKGSVMFMHSSGLLQGERGSPATPAEWAVLRYPENLTLSNLGYFLVAPTLTYQVNYPRSPSIRGKWLGRRLFELVIVLTTLVILLHQFIEPAIANSMKPLQEMDWLRLVERVLKLALPNMYAWLCMFYCLFHLWLNIVAELLRFGDREFYKDWWNANTVGEYWRLWNMPVHKWLLRHVYYPAIRVGLSKWSSMVLVFFVSAVFHELILGVPLHMVRFWAFTGIMLQVPLILISDRINRALKSDNWGNIIFWLSFCVVGQPVTMLIYYHDYLKMQGGL